MIEDYFKDIDITKCLDNYINLYIDTMPKKIYRKVRFKNKHKKRYMIFYNKFHDFMIDPRFIMRTVRRCVNEQNRNTIK